MSMVMELQQAIYSNEEVSNLLIKAYMIARKLGITNIIEWLDNEMNGYAENSNIIPDYRIISKTKKESYTIHQSITQIEHMLSGNKIQDGANVFLETIHTLSKMDKHGTSNNIQDIKNLVKNKISFENSIQTSDLTEILNNVKNKLLDWALELEEQKILGENMTFNEEDKEKAKAITPIINNTINNYGHNSNIQAGGNNNTIESSNTFTVKNKEDLTNQFNKLTELLIEHKEHSNYKNVIDDISYIKNQLSRENIEKSTISNLWNKLSLAIELLVGGALSGAISGVTAGITQNLLF